ncbi:MAG: hypothetical protein ACREJX_11115, partial [Polyangiaceae bacterium]
MQDEAGTERLVELLRDRRLALNDITPDISFHAANPRFESEARAALAAADVVYVCGQLEAEALRVLLPTVDVISTPPPVPLSVAPKAVDALVGREGFVLLHAPIESSQNQLQAVRAAERTELPLVIVGPTTDADYAATLRAFAGDRTLIVGEPDAATLEGLYRRAEVFLDIAWVGCGLARCARAISRGAALVVSARMPSGDLGMTDFAYAVDPADVEAIARGLGDAWYRRLQTPEEFARARVQFATRAGVRSVTRAVVAGYSQALERRNSLVAR